MTTKAPTRENRLADEFRDRLAWARLELARTVAVSDDDLEAIAAHECREIAEEPATATIGDLLARIKGSAREALAEIDAAPARLEAGAFGLCEACRRPIALARLRGAPTARRCGDCGNAPGIARRPRLVCVVVAAVALLVSACVAHGQGEALAARGQTAFATNGCYGCHVVGKAGTPIGPELTHVGARYSADYLMRWLRDPALQRPSAHMPALELSDEDIRALAVYLASLH
jgi:RNA polymerase-binding transcription factor DksA/cytochrome c2